MGETAEERGDFPYVDVAFHNEKFYAMDDMAPTIAVDPSSLEVTQIVSNEH